MGNITNCFYEEFSECVNHGTKPEGDGFDIQYYKDQKGTLREHRPQHSHNAADELNFVAARDSFIMKPHDEWFLISTEWLASWLEFAKGTSVNAPGKINNLELVDKEKPKKLNSQVTVKKDFRCVYKDVWNFFFERYGGGPVLYFLGTYISNMHYYESGL